MQPTPASVHRSPFVVLQGILSRSAVSNECLHEDTKVENPEGLVAFAALGVYACTFFSRVGVRQHAGKHNILRCGGGLCVCVRSPRMLIQCKPLLLVIHGDVALVVSWSRHSSICHKSHHGGAPWASAPGSENSRMVCSQ